MRVTMVAPLVAPLRAAQAGGAQAVLVDLARALTDHGVDLTLVAPRGSRVPGVRLHTAPGGPYPEALVRSTAQPTTIRAHHPRRAAKATPPRDWPAIQAPAYLSLAAALRSQPPDVVHAHALDWPVFYALAATGIPTVHTLHLGPIDAPAVEAARAAARAGRPRPRFVAVSRALARQWHGILSVDAVIPNGVDPASIPFSDRPDPELALVAGRIAPEKGTHLAIAAALRAGLRVDLAGDVYDRDYFAELVAPLLGARVRHLGPLPRTRLARLYGRAAVAVVASLWEEPFGMVALEANLAGTPVAGFARGALAEVIGSTGGVLADHATVPALTRAIRQATTRDRAAIRRTAARRHPLTRMAQRYGTLYEDIIRSA